MKGMIEKIRNMDSKKARETLTALLRYKELKVLLHGFLANERVSIAIELLERKIRTESELSKINNHLVTDETRI